MPSKLEDYETLPFPVGQSPFRVKGTVYRGHVEYVDANVPGGMKGIIATLHNSELKEFLSQPFLAATLYDIYPLVVMGHVAARLAGNTFPDYVRIRTRHQVEKDLSGVYRILLKIASPEMIATRLPQVVSQYFNFGTSEIRKQRTGCLEAVRGGMPADLADWYGIVGQNYVIRALELNGAKNPKSRLLSSTKAGKIHGVELVTMVFEFRWDP